jgi:hypothetical protein
MDDHHLGHFEVSADRLRANPATRRFVLTDEDRVLAAVSVADAGQGDTVRRVEVFTGSDGDSDAAWNDHVLDLR